MKWLCAYALCCISARPCLVVQVAVGLRSASHGYVPDKAFIIVSFAVTAFLLVGWRTGLSALTKVATLFRVTPKLFNRHALLALTEVAAMHGEFAS